MKSTLTRISTMLALSFLFTAGSPAVAQDFDMSWHTIDGGGGISAGGGFELTGTIAQPDAGAMSGGKPGNDFTLVGGFWTGAGAAGEPACPGDLNNSGAVDVQDLLILLSAWGPCGADPCPADLNSSTAVDVQDLLVLLSAWGPCP